MSEIQSGALIDKRPVSEKEKDWKFREVVASADPVNWIEKPQDQWRKFPIFNQNGSGSCVAQTEAKELGIMRYLKDGNYVHFSASDIYQRRANRPESGMNAIDARKIATTGTTLEVLAPSQNLSDPQMDAQEIEPYKREVGKVFSISNYIEDPTKSIDTIASIIQKTQKGVMVWFYFEAQEWREKPVVINHNLDLTNPITLRHSVCAVDYLMLPTGEKALIIEDSWGTSYGMAGQRIIDECFFANRNWYAGHLINFKFDDQSPAPRPHHVFLTDLVFNQSTGSEVVALQECLKYEGLFPQNAESTGYFGGITLKAVKDFQIKHSITGPWDTAGYGRVGPKTRGKLNLIYGQ